MTALLEHRPAETDPRGLSSMHAPAVLAPLGWLSSGGDVLNEEQETAEPADDFFVVSLKGLSPVPSGNAVAHPSSAHYGLSEGILKGHWAPGAYIVVTVEVGSADSISGRLWAEKVAVAPNAT